MRSVTDENRTELCEHQILRKCRKLQAWGIGLPNNIINLSINDLENENISFYRAIYDPISKKSVKSVSVCCQKNFQLTNKNPRLSSISLGLKEKESFTYNFAGK